MFSLDLFRQKLFAKPWTALLALALLFRVLVPEGFMPVTAHGGELFSLKICSGRGSATILVDQALKRTNPHAPPHAPKTNSGFCLFAAAAHVAAAFMPAVISILLAFAFVIATAGFVEIRILARPRHTIAAPRAPPVFA